tara:strand:+ start:6599 stop:7303 length:705 start_codon:yes stop_codon:yes gene_type:complete
MIRTILLLLALSSAAVSAKTLDDILAKARSFVGPEDKIDSVDSLYYEGVMELANGGPDRVISLLLEKPAKQRLVITQGDGRITMVVNGLEGFMMQENLTTGESGFAPLPLEQVRRFKANAAENLFFFEFPASAQVRVKYLGETDFRGETVAKVRYIHPGGVQFIRYFDPATGELVGTETDTGTINTEEGKMVVDGLNFSEKVLSYEGDELANTITFSIVEVNPDVDEDSFSFPN